MKMFCIWIIIRCYFAFLSKDMFVFFTRYSLRYLSLKLYISSIEFLLLRGCEAIRVINWDEFLFFFFFRHGSRYPGARGFFLVGGDRIERRLRVAKRREKNLWYQRITTSLPCRRQFPLIDIRS